MCYIKIMPFQFTRLCIYLSLFSPSQMYMIAIYKTSGSRHITPTNKLFIAQCGADLLFTLTCCPFEAYIFRYTSGLCLIDSYISKLSKILYKVSIMGTVSTCMAVVVPVLRYIKIAKQASCGTGQVFIVVLTSTGILTRIVSRLVMVSMDESIGFKTAFLINQAGKMLLLIIILLVNFLLLKNVLQNAMPKNSRSHKNELTLTKTIIITNVCFIVMWLPRVVCSYVGVLFSLELIEISYQTFQNFWHLRWWSALGVYINCAINALLYIVRIKKFRRFYWQLLRTMAADRSPITVE